MTIGVETITQVTHDDGRSPEWYEVYFQPRRVTLRAFIAKGSEADAQPDKPAFLRQPAPARWWDFRHVLFKGEFLDPSLKGKTLQLAGQTVLDLDDPSIQPMISDCACWVFYSEYGKLSAPINRFAIENGKLLTAGHDALRMNRRPLTIWQRFATDDLSQTTWHIYHEKSAFFVRLPGPVTPGKPVVNVDAPLPSLKLLAPPTIAPNAYATVAVNLVEQTGAAINHDCTVYLEAISGYLPKTRVDLKGGAGQFNVMSLGLQSGDVLEVRAGFKFVSNLASVQLKVQ